MKTRVSVSTTGKLSKKHQCPPPTQDRGSEPGGEGRDPREFQGAAARVTSSDPVQTPEQQFANKKSRSEVSSAKVTQYIGSNDGRSPIKDIFKC